MITQADVKTIPNGASLYQSEKQLSLKITEPEGLNVSVVSLDPPPLLFDKKMKNLKRLEIRIPAYVFKEQGMNKIVVELRGEK